MAKTKSRSKEEETPFKKQCKESFNYNWNGGKPDDITVVVAWVVKQPKLHNN